MGQGVTSMHDCLIVSGGQTTFVLYPGHIIPDLSPALSHTKVVIDILSPNKYMYLILAVWSNCWRGGIWVQL